MEHLPEILANVRKEITGKLAILNQTITENTNSKQELDALHYRKKTYEQAAQLLKDLYEQTQERFHKQIMQIVTYCLSEIFGADAYTFRIIFEQKRNQVEARMVFIRDGEEFDPVQASGGGCLDIAAFALRLATVYLTRKTIRSLMILDEPFRYLSVDYRPKIAALLEKLSTEFDFQFIMITHIPELAIGKVHRLG